MSGIGAAMAGSASLAILFGIPPWVIAVLVGIGLSFGIPKAVQVLESDKPRRLVKRTVMASSA